MQLATTIHSHREQSSFVGPKELWTTTFLRQKGHICHHNAMGLLHIVQTLERESYVDGNRASDRAQAQKSARFTATKKRSLSWNPVQQQQPPGMWAACLLKLPRAPSHPAKPPLSHT